MAWNIENIEVDDDIMEKIQSMINSKKERGNTDVRL